MGGEVPISGNAIFFPRTGVLGEDVVRRDGAVVPLERQVEDLHLLLHVPAVTAGVPARNKQNALLVRTHVPGQFACPAEPPAQHPAPWPVFKIVLGDVEGLERVEAFGRADVGLGRCGRGAERDGGGGGGSCGRAERVPPAVGAGRVGCGRHCFEKG